MSAKGRSKSRSFGGVFTRGSEAQSRVNEVRGRGQVNETRGNNRGSKRTRGTGNEIQGRNGRGNVQRNRGRSTSLENQGKFLILIFIKYLFIYLIRAHCSCKKK